MSAKILSEKCKNATVIVPEESFKLDERSQDYLRRLLSVDGQSNSGKRDWVVGGPCDPSPVAYER